MRDDDPGHGPYFQLVAYSGGRKTTRSVSPRSSAILRIEVEECQRLRRLTSELIEVSEQLSDTRLRSDDPQAGRRAKEKPAHRSSSLRSKPRSPAS